MTPEQIKERLSVIMHLIEDAKTGIFELQHDLAQSSNDTDGILQVLMDIAADVNLHGMKNQLAAMQDQLDRNIVRCLPYHFDRLRSGTP